MQVLMIQERGTDCCKEQRCSSEQNGLEDLICPEFGSLQEFISGVCDKREEALVLFGLKRLYQYDERPPERKAFETIAALSQHAPAHVQGDIRIVEVVEKIKYQHRVALGPCVREQVEQLVAGEGSGDADATYHIVDSGCLAAQSADKGVGRQPLAACNGVQGPVQGHGCKQFGDAFAQPAPRLDQQQARNWGMK